MAGVFLICLAIGFAASLIFPGNWGIFFVVLAYSNLLPTATVVLGYHVLRGSQLSPGMILLVALLSILTIPIAAIFFIPLGAACIVLAVYAFLRRPWKPTTTRGSSPVVAAMVLWPAAMVATLVLPGSIVQDSYGPLFSGMSLTWAMIGFELVVLAYDSSARPNQQRDLRRRVRIESLPFVLAVGMAATVILAFSFRAIPDFHLWDSFLNVLVLTIGLPLATVGFGNLMVASFRLWLPKARGILPA
jgi:hypothetical protein